MTYAWRRAFTFVLTVLLVLMMTFAVFRIIPGNPALTILGMEADEAQVAALEAKLGTDRPLGEQFASWLGGVVSGDLGESLKFSRPVGELILDRLPVTASLAVLSMAITIVIAVPLGIAAAKSQRRASGWWISLLSQLGLAVPSFWLGILLVLLFALTFRWFPAGGYVRWSESPLAALRSLFLPALAVAIPQVAVVVRYLRTTMLEQLKQDYVRTGYSKGLRERAVLYKHVLKNALIPVVTVMGMIFADVLGGSLVVEQVFALPGLGRLLVSSIGARDFPLVQGMILFTAVTVIAINFAVDMLYRVLDPRIRLK
ncbi:ABC transporter permease [Paenibacillus elgii]|uniref:ABC transporter permease n=2 Tax=Paenibacillus elgii TaxID=189691 RepID=A0A2T6G619_9BACL|nr:ABC transporter permease [Paenibacillus elgii]NEN86615.1 ABC transporter permease [Paenibacillus elgii]PUA39602.1 ABC transporter permease [Paenibacillus elgii]